MLNRLLYWFVTLPILSKFLFVGATMLLFFISCSTLATIPASQERARVTSQQTAITQQSKATQTALTQQSEAQQVATAQQIQQVQAATQQVLSIQAATSTTQAQTNAHTAQATADAQTTQNANSTAVAFGPLATQTALVESAGSMPAVGDAYLYSSETSHSVTSFASRYVELGGTAALGFPITELFVEQSPADGKGYWVQYFEKGVMEHHSDKGEAQLATLGVWRFNEKYKGGAPPVKPVIGGESHLFTETNHTVSDPFLKYWKERGQVGRFGYPISEAFEEKSDADGKPYIVQYFERAVMEFHPELPTAQNVQLTALGSLRHNALYPSGAPMAASDPIPSPTINASATAVAVANITATAVQVEFEAAVLAQARSDSATATAEAAKVLSPAEQAYITEATDWLEAYTTASTWLSDLMDEMSEDVSLLFDDDWKIKMAAALALLKLTGDDILNYESVPPKFANVHTEFKTVATNMNRAADLYAEGIDNLDSDAIDQANGRVQTASAAITRVQTELEKIER